MVREPVMETRVTRCGCGLAAFASAAALPPPPSSAMFYIAPERRARGTTPPRCTRNAIWYTEAEHERGRGVTVVVRACARQLQL
eukprot:COSAG02_NODE_4801_length_4960_cov_3.266406_7_plen_84_part_00